MSTDVKETHDHTTCLMHLFFSCEIEIDWGVGLSDCLLYCVCMCNLYVCIHTYTDIHIWNSSKSPELWMERNKRKDQKRGTHAITEIAIPRRDGGVVETGMTLSEIIIQTYVYQSV